MTFGIPPNVMALLLAPVIHGLQPGPLLITQNPGLFWGIVASMYIGNVMLLVLNSAVRSGCGCSFETAVQHPVPADHPVHHQWRLLQQQ